jgi:hypothetical protein
MEPTRYVSTRASSSQQACGVLSDASRRERGILEAARVYDQEYSGAACAIHRRFVLLSYFGCAARPVDCFNCVIQSLELRNYTHDQLRSKF